MFSFMRDLLALPLKILVYLGYYTKSPQLLGMQKLVWQITGRCRDGVSYIGYFYKIDIREARRRAVALLEESTSGCLHALIAAQDFQITRDYQWIRQRLKEAEQRELKEAHMLLYPRLMLENDPEEMKMLAEQVLGRNDFPTHVSALAYYNLSLYHLEKGDQQKAGELITHCLQIEENPSLRIAGMALSLLEGRDDFEKQAAYLPQKPADYPFYGRALAYAEAGDLENAGMWLKKCTSEFLIRIRCDRKIETQIKEILSSRGEE